METLSLNKESEALIKSILHIDSLDEVIDMDYRTDVHENSFRRKLNKDIDRIIFPWYKRFWMKLNQILFSWGWWFQLFQPKIKIYDRYQILKNENKKRNRKSARKL